MNYEEARKEIENHNRKIYMALSIVSGIIATCLVSLIGYIESDPLAHKMSIVPEPVSVTNVTHAKPTPKGEVIIGEIEIEFVPDESKKHSHAQTREYNEGIATGPKPAVRMQSSIPLKWMPELDAEKAMRFGTFEDAEHEATAPQPRRARFGDGWKEVD